MSGFSGLKIAQKLPLVVVGAAFLASASVGIGGYVISSATVAKQTEDKLMTVAVERARELSSFLDATSDDLLITAASTNTITSLANLQAGWAQMKSDQSGILRSAFIETNAESDRSLLNEANLNIGLTYDMSHARLHPGFRLQARTRGYGDIYLFDIQGNLLYSVNKGDEYATSFAPGGIYADTALGRVYQEALAMTEPGHVAYADLAPYAPTPEMPAGFVATPIFNGAVLSGVVAFRLPTERVSAMLANRLGLGETGETFIVGPDGRMRNDSAFSAENDMLATEYRNPAVEVALAGDVPSTVRTTDYRGMPMLAYATPMSFEGSDWALVATISEAEAMAPLTRMRNLILPIAVLALLISAALGFYFSRTVTKPVTRLTRAMGELADGNLDVAVSGADRADELGAMARAVEIFREQAMRVRQLTEDERRNEDERQAERAEMIHSLQRGFGDVVDAAVAGDFSRRVEFDFDDPELNSLAQSINNLVETVQRGLGQSVSVLGGLAEADLTGRVHGDFQGAFGRLRDDLNKVGDTLTTTLVGLRHTSRSLKTATREILSGANDLSERTTQQSSTIEETSSAIAQLSATVAENARRASEATVKAQSVSHAATEGGEVMRRANDAMDRITASSGKIASIIRLIDDIAFQTNLLALNASVEAARAGEAGRGFAVVAVEVRRLAQSAAKASSDVKSLIEESGNDVRGGSRLVAEAAEKLLVMLTAARESSGLIEGIAKASQEQAAGIEEVSRAIGILDSMTQHNAALVEETNASLEQAQAQAIELDRIVDGFVLERDQPAARAA